VHFYKRLIIAHGGAGSSPKYTKNVMHACKAGYEILKNNGCATDAVETAISILEDSEMFNAGAGAVLRLDKTIELDAAIMDSDLNCGAVAAIKNIKNPIKAARIVMERTPYVLLVGNGANRLIKQYGFKEHKIISQKAIARHKKLVAKLKSKKLPDAYRGYTQKLTHLLNTLNIDLSAESMVETETVGAVAYDIYGKFAAGSSTGGISIGIKGRVGDTPIIGAGVYAGPNGAVTLTGIGEEIIKICAAKYVYDLLSKISAQRACRICINRLKPVPTGVIAISKKNYGIACTKRMAYYVCGD
jgi:isoaspartyl peptidase/L-asparaginase-like protein (Ntn-hydrolase superfamily)